MFTGLPGRRVLATTAALAGIGAAAVSAAPAEASTWSPSYCATDAPLSQPFAGWGDASRYRLLAGGDFEAGAPGWTLDAGASLVGGGDPFALTGVASTAALSLPAGASAQSPFTCVDSTQPTFRFVATGSPDASVGVAVVYRRSAKTVTVPVGTLTPGGDWQPSPTYQNGQALTGALTGSTAQMSVRLTAVSGAAQVDDVFVDPHIRG